MGRLRFRGRSGVLEFDIPEDLTVADVRSLIHDSDPTSFPNVRLLYRGELLHDSRVLGRLSLSPTDHIVLHNAPSPTERPSDPDSLKALLDLGFPRPQCLEALRSAHGDVTRAADILLSGPAVDPHRELREHLLKNPSALEEVIRNFEAASPDEEGRRFRQNPEELLRFLGIDAALFDLEAVRGREPSG
jgi:hypothetical protein